MKSLMVAIVSGLMLVNLAQAAESCEAQAQTKKLSGAAKTSFTKKCEADAKSAGAPSCEDQAATKKLAGAAKTSFVKKCVADAKG